MSVIAFTNPSESPLGYLLEQTQRRRVANEVNSALLRSQKQELGEHSRCFRSVDLSYSLDHFDTIAEPMLPTMVQQLYFMEDQLKAKINRRSQGIRVEDSTS